MSRTIEEVIEENRALKAENERLRELINGVILISQLGLRLENPLPNRSDEAQRRPACKR